MYVCIYIETYVFVYMYVCICVYMYVDIVPPPPPRVYLRLSCLDLHWLFWFVGTGPLSIFALPESQNHKRSQCFSTLSRSKRSKSARFQCFGPAYHQNLGTFCTSIAN